MIADLIQTRHGPDCYVPSIFFDTMPSAPSRHAWANTVGHDTTVLARIVAADQGQELYD
jgi:hypothetical protein